MVQTQKKDVVRPDKTNKIHKTLRQKLRKKRQVQKMRKKQKSEQKKQYNSEEEKLKFFSKAQNRQDCYKQLKLKKIRKYIDQFINIYEDDLDQFYQMFKTFDDGGFIDISELANKALIKCLKQLFNYLPLKIQKGEYSKIKTSQISLYKFMKQKVSEAIQTYLQNGSDEECQLQSSHDNVKVEKKGKHSHKKIVPKIEESNQNYEELKLYKEMINEDESAVKVKISETSQSKIKEIISSQIKKDMQLKKQNISKEQRQLFQIFQKNTKDQQIKPASKVEASFDQPKKQISDKNNKQKPIEKSMSNFAKIEQRILLNKQLIQGRLKQQSLATKKSGKKLVQKQKSTFFKISNKKASTLTEKNQFV